MSVHISLNDFEEIYNQSYKNVLRYIIQKSQKYLIKIAKNQLSKHYGLLYKIKQHFVIDTGCETDCEMVEEIDSKINIEKEILMKLDAEKVWKYI